MRRLDPRRDPGFRPGRKLGAALVARIKIEQYFNDATLTVPDARHASHGLQLALPQPRGDRWKECQWKALLSCTEFVIRRET